MIYAFIVPMVVVIIVSIYFICVGGGSGCGLVGLGFWLCGVVWLGMGVWGVFVCLCVGYVGGGVCVERTVYYQKKHVTVNL